MSSRVSVRYKFSGRGDKVRTRDLYVPNVARYQLRYTPILRLQIYDIYLFSRIITCKKGLIFTKPTSLL